MEVSVVLLIGQLLLKYGPDIAALYASLVSRKEPPTPADWEAFFARIGKTGDSYFVKPA